MSNETFPEYSIMSYGFQGLRGSFMLEKDLGHGIWTTGIQGTKTLLLAIKDDFCNCYIIPYFNPITDYTDIKTEEEWDVLSKKHYEETLLAANFICKINTMEELEKLMEDLNNNK